MKIMFMRAVLRMMALAFAHGASCPDGWTPGAGRCYRLTDVSTTWGCVDLRGLREVEPGALLRWGLRGAVALGNRLVARVSAREC